MEHGHLGLLLSISCCQLLSQQILFSSLLLDPPSILAGLPASPCNVSRQTPTGLLLTWTTCQLSSDSAGMFAHAIMLV